MAQILNGQGIEQIKDSNGNGTRRVEPKSEDKSKVSGIDDILAYEDKWIGWDGPVWCSRYERFENQEDASADDGYTIKGQLPHQDLGLERCEKHGCSCRVPFQHRSYVQDIQRRVEPVVASLIKLEQQVATLVHHHSSAHEIKGNETKPRGGGFAERYDDTTIRHVPNNTSRTDHSQHSTESMRESFWKLETRVENLVRQMHELMNAQGHYTTKKELDDGQGGN